MNEMRNEFQTVMGDEPVYDRTHYIKLLANKTDP